MRFNRIKIIHIEKNRKLYGTAKALGWAPSKISMIINGSYTPSSIEKELLAEELETTVGDLFSPESMGTV